MSSSIHQTAFISPKASLGENITIGPCVVIEDDTIIGDGCKIDAFASIKQYTRLGKNNTIHSHAMVGGTPQDLKFQDEISWLEIGDNNVIREFSTMHRGTEGGGGITRIGNNNLLMAYTHVAHDCHLGSNIVMSNNATLAGHVTVEDFAIIGGLSAVHQFVRVGTHAFLGGFSGVSKDIPPYFLAAGSRASLVGINAVGLRRLGAPTETINSLKKIYKIIWLSGIPRSEALIKVEEEFASLDMAKRIVTFIKESPRGVVSPERGASTD